MLSADELMVLDDFRFKRRMPSRAAAIRELLKRGLAGEGFQAAAFGAKSEEFGVIGRKPDGREKSSGLSLSQLAGRQEPFPAHTFTTGETRSRPSLRASKRVFVTCLIA